jgi:hypothetical protein
VGCGNFDILVQYGVSVPHRRIVLPHSDGAFVVAGPAGSEGHL